MQEGGEENTNLLLFVYARQVFLLEPGGNPTPRYPLHYVSFSFCNCNHWHVSAFCTNNYKGGKVKDEKQSWGTFPPSVSWLRSQGKVTARSYVSPSHSPRHLKALKLGAILEASSPKIVVQASNWVVSGWTEHETWHEMAA